MSPDRASTADGPVPGARNEVTVRATHSEPITAFDSPERDSGTAAAQLRPVAAGRGPGIRNLPDSVFGVAGVLAFAALLELLPRTGVLPRAYFPPLSEMLAALIDLLGRSSFWTALFDTVRGWGIGLTIAVAAGIIIGFLISTSTQLIRITASTIEFLRPIPSVALIPLAVLLFGTDIRSTLLLVVYASFWPVLIQVLHGVQDINPVARDTTASYGFSRWAVFRYLIWPTALPYLMTGVRLSASVALVLTISAELIIGSPGLGTEIARSQSSDATADVYATVIVTGVLGIALNILVRSIERRVLSWHASMRKEVSA